MDEAKFYVDEDQIDYLEAERARRLDLTVRAWFVFTALENGNNARTDLAHDNYAKFLENYMTLFTNVPTEVLIDKVEKAKAEAFYTDFAKNTLGRYAKEVNLA